VLVVLILFLPETLRKIAGDGTRPLYGIHRPLIYKRHPDADEIPPDMRYKAEKPSFRTLLESFRLLAEKDVFVALLFGGIIYTIWSMITSSTASLFKKEYKLTDIQVGLAFLPNGMNPRLPQTKLNLDSDGIRAGLGCVTGSLVTGKLMDRDYRIAATAYKNQHALADETELKQQTYPDFPLERARLANVWWLLILFSVSTGVYGFAVEWHIAVPLTMQFLCNADLYSYTRPQLTSRV
jgi:hypothetical protein